MDSFKNIIGGIFTPGQKAIEKARQKIAHEEAKMAHERGVMTQLAAAMDREKAARAGFERLCAGAKSFCNPFPMAAYVHDFLLGKTPAAIAADMLAHDAFAANFSEFEAELRRQTVVPAEQALAEFRERNKVIIRKYPVLTPAPEPPFVAAEPAREWSDFVPASAPSDGVRLMLGLKPNEKVPPAHWERQPDTGGIKIRDLDNNED